MSEMVDRLMEARYRRTHIYCPHCQVEQANDDGQYPVTYWGSEAGPTEMECQACSKTFVVRENVERTYDAAPTREDI